MPSKRELGPRRREGMACVALAAAALLGGCIADPPRSHGGGTAAGGWELAAGPGCTQHLSIAADGRFTLAAWVTQGSLADVEQVQGSLGGGPLGGAFAARFAPDAAVSPGAGPYCAQWQQTNAVELPLADAATQLGADPATLIYTPSVVPGVGTVLAGTDPARRDRLVLYSAVTGPVHAIAAGDPAEFPNGIYRALASDPPPEESSFSGFTLVTLPAGYMAQRFLGTTGGQGVAQWMLYLTAASDVTFSNYPGSSTVTCDLVAYSDLNGSVSVPGALATGVTSQTVTLNPADPGWPFATQTVGGTTAYLVPLRVFSPADGDCEVYISAQSIAERSAAEHAAAGTSDVFSAPVPEGSYLLGHRPGATERQERLPLQGTGIPLGPIVLSGSVVTLPSLSGPAGTPSAADPLHLADGSAAASWVTVTGSGASWRLSLYPSAGAGTGLGPFVPMGSGTGPDLSLPGRYESVAGSGDAVQVLRIRVSSPTRAAFWSEGGAATRGHLVDALGRTLALSAGGAADGAGFRIHASLAAGDYTLRVAAGGAAYAVNAELLTGPADFPDAGLEDCLVEAGWAQYPATPVTAAWCARRNITSLAGIGQAATLATLDLRQNGLTTLDGIEDLIQLQTLLAGGNPLEDLSALAALPSLRRLSLAAAPLPPESVAALQALAPTLTLLDLTAVTTLSGDDVDALRTALPFTLVIGPDGAVPP